MLAELPRALRSGAGRRRRDGRRRHDRDRRRGRGGRRRALRRERRRTSRSSRRSSASARAAPTRVVLDPIDGSINAKRGLPFFSLSVAVAEGGTMDDVVFGYVYDFGTGEEWTAERGGGARLNGAPLDRRAAEGPDRAARARGDADRPRRRHAPPLVGLVHRLRDLRLARALALPSRRRPRRRGLLAEAGALGRHRRRAAARPRARLRDRAARGARRSRSAPLDLEGRSRVVAAGSEALVAELAQALSI